MDSFQSALEHLRENRDQIYECNFRKKYARQRFACYSGKQKSIAKAMNRLEGMNKDSGAPVAIAYGNGSFPPGQKGERFAPVNWVKDAVKVRFGDQFEEVDEYRTSKVCIHCNCQLWLCAQRGGDGRVYTIRGLMYCGSAACRSCPIKDRDEVGAFNIWRRATGCAPDIMNRGSPAPWERDRAPVIIAAPNMKAPRFLRRKNRRGCRRR